MLKEQRLLLSQEHLSQASKDKNTRKWKYMGIEHQIHTDVMESKSNKERVFFPVFMIIKEEYTTGIELFKKKM